MSKKIHLDSHAATRPLTSSIETMLPFLQEHWGATAPPSDYTQSILEELGAHPKDAFYFFPSSGEAINHVFLSHYFEDIRSSGKNHILTTNTEEIPIFESLKRLEDLGCYGKLLPVNEQGQLTRTILEEALGPRTSLLSLSWANGLTGVIHPIADLAEACKAKGVRLHVDASYVIGKYCCPAKDLDVDFLTFEGSLIHSPQGTAGLLVKENTAFSAPLSSITGVPAWGLAALTKALQNGTHLFDHVCLETARLRDKLERGIQEGISGAQVLFQTADRLPNCTAIAFPEVSGEALLFLLHRKGIYASIGGGRSPLLSSLLIAAGYETQVAYSALSFSLSFETTEEEIDKAIQSIISCVQQLRGLSHQLFKEIT